MSNLERLSARDDAGHVRVVVEAPRGSSIKLRYDAQSQAFTFQRVLPNLHYPYDWGFIPSTRAEDGDPLDALVIHDGATWPGVIIPSKIIGVLKLREHRPGQPEHHNHRLILVPHAQARLDSVEQLPADERQSLAEFFRRAGELARKQLTIEGWADPEQAERVLTQAIQAASAPRS